MARLMILIASTRPGRRGAPVGRWIADRAREHGLFDVDVADLAEIALPFVDEPEHPISRTYVHQHTKDWSARVVGADAFVFVMPEYNHGFTAPLKNAIDFLHAEWQNKPVGFVSYGGVSAGLRAVNMLKAPLVALRLVPAFSAVSIPFIEKLIVDGELVPNESMQVASTAMLDELATLEAGLRQLRSATK